MSKDAWTYSKKKINTLLTWRPKATLVAHSLSSQSFPRASSELLLWQASLPLQPRRERVCKCHVSYTHFRIMSVPSTLLSVAPLPTQALCTSQRVSKINSETKFTHTHTVVLCFWYQLQLPFLGRHWWSRHLSRSSFQLSSCRIHSLSISVISITDNTISFSVPKVSTMLDLIEEIPSLQGHLFAQDTVQGPCYRKKKTTSKMNISQ